MMSFRKASDSFVLIGSMTTSKYRRNHGINHPNQTSNYLQRYSDHSRKVLVKAFYGSNNGLF